MCLCVGFSSHGFLLEQTSSVGLTL